MAVTKFTDVSRDFASRISSEMEDGDGRLLMVMVHGRARVVIVVDYCRF